MHIPDGFVSVPVAAATALASVGVVAVALMRSPDAFGIRLPPIIGLTAAFIFAAQMVNFPLPGGTSGHLFGGTLAGVILGSFWAGVLCISTICIIQAILFADGSITALGANIFNIGVVGVWVGWVLTQTLQRLFGGSRGYLPLAAGIAAGISVVAAAVVAAIELALSGTASADVVLTLMTSVYILTGIGEGLITGGVIAYLATARPDLLPGEQLRFQGWLVPVVSILLIAGVLPLIASAWPDGLNNVAQYVGFIELANNVRVRVPTPLANYQISGLGLLGKSIAGLIGSVVCFGVAFGIASLVRQKHL